MMEYFLLPEPQDKSSRIRKALGVIICVSCSSWVATLDTVDPDSSNQDNSGDGGNFTRFRGDDGDTVNAGSGGDENGGLEPPQPLLGDIAGIIAALGYSVYTG